jgi:hypothetical protein
MSTVTNMSAFLAGFSLAAVVVIVDGSEHFRWPGVALLALAVGSVMLILAVQSSRLGGRVASATSARDSSEESLPLTAKGHSHTRPAKAPDNGRLFGTSGHDAWARPGNRRAAERDSGTLSGTSVD